MGCKINNRIAYAVVALSIFLAGSAYACCTLYWDPHHGWKFATPFPEGCCLYIMLDEDGFFKSYRCASCEGEGD